MGVDPEEMYDIYNDDETKTCSLKSGMCGSTDNPETSGETVSSEMVCTTGASDECLTRLQKYKQGSGDVPYSYTLSQGTMDRRVSLTVHPKVTSREVSAFADRVAYVLGQEISYFPNVGGEPNTVKQFYGFLRKALGNTSGLIFPYTPAVTMNHTVNYQQTDILHSNLAFQSYKNTPPPTISLKAVFTADNRKNAIDMLSAIWFLTAMTKCEFGQYNESCKDNRIKALGGLPPPVLYLNGYNNLIDNIPVVIRSVSFPYPDDKNYVNVVLNLTQKGNDYQAEYTINKQDYSASIGKDVGLPEKVSVLGNRASNSNSAVISVWLPTELKINIELLVQPNLLKYQKQWALEDYKSAALMLKPRKNAHDQGSYIVYTTPEGQKSYEMLMGSFVPSGWTW